MHLQKFYKRIEGRFITNISERESVEYHSTSASLNRKNYEVQSFLSPYNAHIVQLEVPANAAFIGKELWQLAWREKYGINIVYIRRGDKIYHIPGRNQLL